MKNRTQIRLILVCQNELYETTMHFCSENFKMFYYDQLPELLLLSLS